MVRFTVKLVLVDSTPITLNFANVNSVSPESAIDSAVRRQWMEQPRSVEVGDCAVVFNPTKAFTSHYIFDIGKNNTLDPKEVSSQEFEFWIENMKNNQARKAGIQMATGEFLLDSKDNKLIHCQNN